MICNNCSKQNIDKAVYCSFCGSKIFIETNKVNNVEDKIAKVIIFILFVSFVITGVITIAGHIGNSYTFNDKSIKQEADIDKEAHRQLEEEWKAQKKAEDEQIEQRVKEREEFERQAAIEKRKKELREQGE
jgi:RNA binding exosome subunit